MFVVFFHGISFLKSIILDGFNTGGFWTIVVHVFWTRFIYVACSW